MHGKKQVLKSIYEPIDDIRIEESYPLRLNREEILKSLMLRNNVAVERGLGLGARKEMRFHERLQTLGESVGRREEWEEKKREMEREGQGRDKRKRYGKGTVNEDLFIHNRISL